MADNTNTPGVGTAKVGNIKSLNERFILSYVLVNKLF